MPLSDNLLNELRYLCRELPQSTLVSFGELLELHAAETLSSTLKTKLLTQVTTPRLRYMVNETLEVWKKEDSEQTCNLVAASLSAIQFCGQKSQDELSVELVWTGPDTSNVSLRRTSQALLQLINNSQQNLTIISFAVYRVPEIVVELKKALDRNVSLRIITESPTNGNENIKYGAWASLGDEIMKTADVFVWDRAKRPVSEKGKRGSLHIKCAFADDNELFISSANLTNYAMKLNMEMGLLIKNKNLTSQVSKQIEGLISQKTLVKI